MAWKSWLCTSRNRPRIPKASVSSEDSCGVGLSPTRASASGVTEYGEGSSSQGGSTICDASDKNSPAPKEQELSSWESIGSDIETDDQKQDSFHLHGEPGTVGNQVSTDRATDRDHGTEDESVQTGSVMAAGLTRPHDGDQVMAHCVAPRELSRRECGRRKPGAIGGDVRTSYQPGENVCGAQKFVRQSQQVRTRHETKFSAGGNYGPRGEGGVSEVLMLDQGERGLTRSKCKLSDFAMKSNLDRALDEWLAQRNNLKEWKAEFDVSLHVDEEEVSDLGSVIDDTAPETIDEASRSFSCRPGLHALAVESDLDVSWCNNRGEKSEWQAALDSWRQELDGEQTHTAANLMEGDRTCTKGEMPLESSNLWASNLESWQKLQCYGELENQSVNEAQACAEHETNSWQDAPGLHSWRPNLEDIREEDRQRGFEASLCADRERNLEVQRALESWAELETEKEQDRKAKLETSLCADRERDLQWQRNLRVWSSDHDKRKEFDAENAVEARERDWEWQSIAKSWRPTEGATKSEARVRAIREELELPSTHESWRKLECQRELERGRKFEASLCAEMEKDAEWQMCVDLWRQAESRREAGREEKFEMAVCADRQGELDWRCFWDMWLAEEREMEMERKRCFETKLGKARHNAWYKFVEAWLSRDSRS